MKPFSSGKDSIGKSGRGKRNFTRLKERTSPLPTFFWRWRRPQRPGGASLHGGGRRRKQPLDLNCSRRKAALEAIDHMTNFVPLQYVISMRQAGSSPGLIIFFSSLIAPTNKLFDLKGRRFLPLYLSDTKILKRERKLKRGIFAKALVTSSIDLPQPFAV